MTVVSGYDRLRPLPSAQDAAWTTAPLFSKSCRLSLQTVTCSKTHFQKSLMGAKCVPGNLPGERGASVSKHVPCDMGPCNRIQSAE